MKNGTILIVMILLSLNSVIPIHAQITLDGTVGSPGKSDLHGPDYDIRAEYGTQAGANLFHSFQQFSIHSGESATFTGPDSVRNIISRVTGGETSWIDGRLASAIPDADMYFLNPAGVMFGPNASLDLGGSFRVSTADYLRMGGNDRFYALPHASDVLSVAAPAAFGFLDSDVAPIQAEGRGEITEQEWENHPTGLHLSEGKNIMLAGGDIRIGNGTRYTAVVRDESGDPVLDGDGNPVTDTEYPGELKSPGTLDVRAGDVIRISGSDGDSKYSVNDGSGWVPFETAGRAGTVAIRAGSVSVTGKSSISTATSGNGSGGGIDIEAGDIRIGSDSSVTTDSDSTDFGGPAGRIRLVAGDTVELTGGAALRAEARSAGGGQIFADAGNRIYMLNAATTSNVSQGGSNGGDVSLSAESVVLNHAGVSANADEGDGGAIFITAENFVRSSDSGVTATSKRGNEGTVRIEAPDADISGSLTVLPGTYLNAAKWAKTPCEQRAGKRSRFVIKGRDAVPTPLDDLRPSPSFGPSRSAVPGCR